MEPGEEGGMGGGGGRGKKRKGDTMEGKKGM
jgi:hypothetical protein